jgi:hypothetical protein
LPWFDYVPVAVVVGQGGEDAVSSGHRTDALRMMTAAPISGTQASSSSGQQEGARGEVCDDSGEEGTDARADEEDEPLIPPSR